MSAARVGEHSDAEWKCVYRSPCWASLSMFGVGIVPPKVLSEPEPASSSRMSSTLGAPLGGTTRGGHQGFDSAAVCLISPPKFGGTGGRALDVSDSVNAGDPGFAGPAWPLTGTCAKTATSTAAATPATTTERTILRFMIFTPSYAWRSASGAARPPA